MSNPEQITCKPTPWFTLRALAMLAMFSVFAVLFYVDGTTGYRKKNLEYYVHATFQKASDSFAKKNSEGELTAEEWEEFATQQSVKFPEDKNILPADTKLPMPWPEILTKYDKIKPLQPHLLWQEYSGEMGYDKKPPKKPFDAGKIREQIIVLYICLALTFITLFFLIRTIRRSVSADNEGVSTVKGEQIPYSDMKTLDLRKWDTKGIAFIEYSADGSTKRTRIDGLTYGGFKKENGEPAEELMRKIRSNFSGEIIEYTVVEESDTPEESPKESTETDSFPKN
ncbi:MAG: hypothetical protein AB8D78_07265 [Akkermansiaceae bacterium]